MAEVPGEHALSGDLDGGCPSSSSRRDTRARWPLEKGEWPSLTFVVSAEQAREEWSRERVDRVVEAAKAGKEYVVW